MANTPGLGIFCQNYGFDQDCILDNLLFHNFFWQNKNKTGPNVKDLNNIILLLYDDNTRFFSFLRAHLR